MNPLDALATLTLGFFKERKLQQWLILIFELLFSGLFSFLTTCGGALVSGVKPAMGIGLGMIASSVSMVILFRHSPLTKGMLLVIPQVEAQQELDSNFQTIQRNK